MATIINADTSDGLKLTSDTSGQIDLQSAGSTKATIDTSGNLKFNSGFGSVSTTYGVRAWVNFDGIGTISINASGGVSSLTDIANAAYRVNFATAMPDTNFTMCISTRVHGYDRTQVTPRTTTSCEVGTFTVGGTGTEYDPVNVIFVR